MTVNTMKTRFISVMLLLGLLLPLASPLVTADGTPIVPIDVHSTLRENRQLAYIKTDGENQTMELFVNIASLDPGEKLTWLVPLRTEPTEISVKASTDKEFREKHNIPELFREGKRQNEGFSRVTGHVFGEAGAKTTAYFCMGLPMFLFGESMQFMSTGPPKPVYEGQGFSVQLRNFQSQASLQDYYNSLNLSLPEQVKETLDAYGSFSVAIIDLTTQAPIPQERFRWLQENAPLTMEKLRFFVKETPSMRVRKYHDPDRFIESGVENDELQNIYAQLEEELGETFNSGVSRDFNHLVRAVYGYGVMKGYTLAVTQPLFKGKAFFPLGTTPSWSASGEIEVIFECPENSVLDFDKEADSQVFRDHNHYYLWNFNGEAPGYDLEGDFEEKDTAWQQRWHHLNGRVHDNAMGLAYLVSFLVYFMGGILAVLGGQWLFRLPLNWKKATKLATLAILTSLVMPPLFVVLIFLLIITTGASDPPTPHDLRKRRRFIPKQKHIFLALGVVCLSLILQFLIPALGTALLCFLLILVPALGIFSLYLLVQDSPVALRSSLNKGKEKGTKSQLVSGACQAIMGLAPIAMLLFLPTLGMFLQDLYRGKGGSDELDSAFFPILFFSLGSFFFLLAYTAWRVRIHQVVLVPWKELLEDQDPGTELLQPPVLAR